MPETHCPACGRRITRSARTGVEYGHAKSAHDNQRGDGRCPRRPASVDPSRNGAQKLAGVPLDEVQSSR